jgi:hypothetical protein
LLEAKFLYSISRNACAQLPIFSDGQRPALKKGVLGIHHLQRYETELPEAARKSERAAAEVGKNAPIQVHRIIVSGDLETEIGDANSADSKKDRQTLSKSLFVTSVAALKSESVFVRFQTIIVSGSKKAFKLQEGIKAGKTRNLKPRCSISQCGA